MEEYNIIKLLIGGSPCTHWSIAQSKNRETTAKGIGWELFKNYLIAKEKFKPDFFLYENNKSAAQPIKDQISYELGAPLQYINSALVSAQNRQRFYAHNFGDVPQPEDRGILLRDILDSGTAWREKSYCLNVSYYKGVTHKNKRQLVTEPIRIGTIENTAKNLEFDSQQYRVYSSDGKSVTICGNGGGVGAKTGLYATPIEEANYEVIDGAKIFVANGKIRQGDGKGSKQGKYVYTPLTEKTNTIGAGQAHNEKVLIPKPQGEWKNVYEVKNEFITIKDKQYSIGLSDGYYIIRKLTPIECERLQTMPDNYTAGVSSSQRYKQLGNGWTAEVIIHLLGYGLKDIPLDEEILVLSMYDGIATGRYCLERLGFTNVRYYAYEIDKYAIQTALKNYPDIIECGDAIQIREDGWKIF